MGKLFGNPSAFVNMRIGRSLKRMSPSPFVPIHRLPSRSAIATLKGMFGANGSNLVPETRKIPVGRRTHRFP